MRAAFWIASGDYVKEAYQSIRQFKQIMPDIDAWLACPDKCRRGPADHLLRLPKREQKFWYLDSTHYYNIVYWKLMTEGYNRLLAFDVDTYLVLPIYDLFNILDMGFNLLYSHAAARETCKTVAEIPESFPEPNIGVMAFTDHPRVGALFNQWFLLYKDHSHVYGNNDQGPLREALWLDKGNVRSYVIPHEYNCRFRAVTQARLDVKCLHGRCWSYPEVARRLNSVKGFRIWSRRNFIPFKRDWLKRHRR